MSSQGPGLERKLCAMLCSVTVKPQSQESLSSCCDFRFGVVLPAASGRTETPETMLTHMKTKEGNSQGELPESFTYPSEMEPDHAVYV